MMRPLVNELDLYFFSEVRKSKITKMKSENYITKYTIKFDIV